MKFSSEIKIGIIITLAIAATIWGLNFLKGRNILQRVNTYYAVFESIGGLEKNSKIFLNGYKVGQVGNIVFSEDGSHKLIVTLGIEKEFKLPVPSTAVLYDADFMGTKAIQINPGNSGTFHSPGDTLESYRKGGIAEQIEEQLGPIKEKTESLIVTLDSLMSALAYAFDRESAESLRSSFSSLEESAGGMENMMAKNGNLDLLIGNLESITGNLRKQNESLSAALVNLESITDSIAASQLRMAIDNASLTLEQTHLVMDKINRGEGTLGMLVNNDTLYRDLVSLSDELELLLKDLQENPKKYINVSVFGKSGKKKGK